MGVSERDYMQKSSKMIILALFCSFSWFKTLKIKLYRATLFVNMISRIIKFITDVMGVVVTFWHPKPLFLVKDHKNTKIIYIFHLRWL